ncbi:hypothetical protein HPP92_028797 [Vanilla planifolia]|uniref:Uncharacterized protein n=1 Tax=Vanilla planifolia TaxID=51239 RepID=A0A835U2K1_VANPL|nr:hypothetical protein HPP92_028797 [Vanilla planifolia]KAG0446528.1 hypothetical protein HPP92_028786 [Vanilla planifolia]
MSATAYPVALSNRNGRELRRVCAREEATARANFGRRVISLDAACEVMRRRYFI